MIFISVLILLDRQDTSTVESPNRGHFGTNINSSGLSTV